MKYLKLTLAVTAAVGLALGIAFSPSLARAEGNNVRARAHGACVHSVVTCTVDAGLCPAANYSARNSILIQNATSGVDLNITVDGQTNAAADAGILVAYPSAYADELAPNVNISCRCSGTGTVLITECP